MVTQHLCKAKDLSLFLQHHLETFARANIFVFPAPTLLFLAIVMHVSLLFVWNQYKERDSSYDSTGFWLYYLCQRRRNPYLSPTRVHKSPGVRHAPSFGRKPDSHSSTVVQGHNMCSSHQNWPQS